MNKFAACLAALLLLPAGAFARSFTLPASNAIAVVTLPDAWSSKEIEDGVESSSPDKSVYVAIEVVEATDVAAGVEESIKFLLKSGVEVDAATEKKTEFEINGMKAFEIGWTGKDSSGPTGVSVSVVVVDAKNLLLLTYWGSPAGTAANQQALGEIVRSIKKVGG
jgi:hypothetical protein